MNLVVSFLLCVDDAQDVGESELLGEDERPDVGGLVGCDGSM